VKPTVLVAEQTGETAALGVLRGVASFPVMLTSLLLLLSVLTVRSRFDDPDMWWHLKLGEIIWTTHVIPRADFFSYTTNHHSWIPHEWLSQLLIYSAYQTGGYSGLMIWLSLLTSALLITGYGLCWLYSGNAKVAFLGALTMWIFATTGLAIRPQMVGYLLLVVELLLLHLGQTRSPRWFFGLPPLFAIWVNCHGSFFLGLVVSGIYLFSSSFHFRTGSLLSSDWGHHRRLTLTLALILSITALFLNPVGLKQILYPLDTILHQSVGLNSVDEWQPLRLSNPRGVALLAVVGCIFLVIIARRSELLLHELLVLTLGIWLAVSHQRMLFVFGILVGPILSRLLAASWEGYNRERDRPAPNILFITASLLIAFWMFPDIRDLTRQVQEQSPVKAVAFIKTHLSGRMLNDYAYGGYLIWAAPNQPVFIDGRADVFESTGVLNEFGKWATLQDDPETLLNKYQIDFCMLTRQSPMVHVLPLLPNWKLVYSDDLSVIFEHIAPRG
jgi:hypothetical protein